MFDLFEGQQTDLKYLHTSDPNRTPLRGPQTGLSNFSKGPQAGQIWSLQLRKKPTYTREEHRNASETSALSRRALPHELLEGPGVPGLSWRTPGESTRGLSKSA